MEQQNHTTEKLTDKAFSRMLVTSIAAILFFIVCLCSTTYAWFEQSVPNENNEIKAAERCDLTATVTITTADGTETLVTADCSASAVLPNLAAGTYTVTLTLPKDSASGYLVIATTPVQRYYSDFIESHTKDTPHTMTFTLVIADDMAPLTLTLTPRWGIYSGTPDVKDGGTLTISRATP